MTEQLHERLADLAGDVATPVPLDPAGLWRTGKRRQRRRTAAAAVAACAVVLAGVSGMGLLLPAADLAVGPSGSKTTPALPDRLYAPSRWLESNDDDPVGPFAALLTASQGWSGDTAYVGVSATTGEHRSFRLPGSALPPGSGSGAGAAEALSPSGRYVAYWLAGKPSGEVVDNQIGKPTVGVAVYDTETAKVARATVGTEHGLVPESLLWSDDDTLYYQASQITEGHTNGYVGRVDGQGWTLEVGDGRRLVPNLVHIPGLGRSATAILSDHHGQLLFDAAGVGTKARVTLARPVGVSSPVTRPSPTAVDLGIGGAVAPDGSLVGLTHTADERQPNTISISAPGEAFREVPGPQVLRFWALTQRGAVVDLSRVEKTGDYLPTELARISPSGKVTTLVDYPRWDGRIDVLGFATDLLDAPPVHRGEPDWPTDPRIFIALDIGAVILLLGALRIWRRREQR